MTVNKRMKIKCGIILFIAIFSIASRFAIGYMMRDSFFSRGNRYSGISPIAINLIHRGEFSIVPGNPTACNEPMYSLFIALAYFVFGYNWIGPVIFQSLLSLLNAFLIYCIAKEIFQNNRISLLAALLFLFYPFLFLQSISISDTVFFCFWLALSTFLTLRSRKSKAYLKYIFCGISWGITLLTRMSAISLFPFALLYLIFFSTNGKRLKKVFLIIIFSMLTISPWLIRNYLRSGKILISSHGAIEVWLGFNSETSEILKRNISVDIMKQNLEMKIPALAKIDNAEYKNSIVKEYEESKLFLNEALNYIKQDPFRIVKMMPIKFAKFWSWNYNPVPTTSNKRQDRLRRIVYTASYFPILIFALFGFLLKLKYWKDHAILFFLIIGYTMMHMIVYGFTRLRIPLDQFLMIYSAVAIEFLFFRHMKPNG